MRTTLAGTGLVEEQWEDISEPQSILAVLLRCTANAASLKPNLVTPLGKNKHAQHLIPRSVCTNSDAKQPARANSVLSERGRSQAERRA